MSGSSSQNDTPLGRLIVSCGIIWALWTYPPDQLGDPFFVGMWWFAAFCAMIGLLRSVPNLFSGMKDIFKLFRAFGHDETRGSAGWMSEREIRQKKLHRNTKGSRFIGLMGRAALWLQTETHHLILGPAGTQKSTSAIMNILMGCPENALISDIKGELWETTRHHREKAFGHRCVKMDPKDSESSVKINPLDKIAREVEVDDSAALTRVRNMALQLWPDPQGGGGQNEIFYKGARQLMVTTILSVIVVLPPEHRNLAMVYRALSDLDVLHDLLDAASKSLALSGEIADMARSAHAAAFGEGGSAKTFESFRTNALIALEAFGPGNYLAAVTSETTFEFEELKEGKTSFYILIDYNNIAVLGPFSGLLQQMAAGAMVESGNNTPVIFCLDEFCNAPLHTLPKILTLLRSAGVKCIMATQDLDDIVRVYSKHALETVLSETDIKQFLGGIRSKSTLEYLSAYLGEYSELSTSASLGRGGINETVNRTNRRLMTEDELRRLPDGAQIVLHANHKPILSRKVQVFAIAPWREQIGINTGYSTIRKYLPIEVSIGRFGSRVTRRGQRAYREIWNEVMGQRKNASGRLRTQLIGTILPGATALHLIGMLAAAFVLGAPNLRWEYQMNHPARNMPASYAWCRYVGPTAPGVIRGPNCPLILWRKTW